MDSPQCLWSRGIVSAQQRTTSEAARQRFRQDDRKYSVNIVIPRSVEWSEVHAIGAKPQPSLSYVQSLVHRYGRRLVVLPPNGTDSL